MNVTTGMLTLTTTKLTKNLFKQLTILDYSGLQKHNIVADDKRILGWVLFEDDRWLIVELGDGQYARFYGTSDITCKFKQIYIL